MTTPTQVRRPWRATMRTTFQLIIGIAVLLPFVVQASGLDPEVYPWLAGLLAVAAAVTRVMALPQVEDFLQRFLPWLAAEKGSDLGEGGFASLTASLSRAEVERFERLYRESQESQKRLGEAADRFAPQIRSQQELFDEQRGTLNRLDEKLNGIETAVECGARKGVEEQKRKDAEEGDEQ